MTTDIILAVITLALAVVGTLFNPRASVKIGIIFLAVAATVATIVKAHDDNLDKEFIKQALAAQLATARPSPRFKSALQQSRESVAKEHGWQESGSDEKESGVVYFFSKVPSDERAGALVFSPEDLGEAFVNFASNRSLDPIVESAMFKVPDMKNSEQVDRMITELALVANVAIDNGGFTWLTSNADIVTKTQVDPTSVSVSAHEGSNGADVSIGKEWIDGAATLPPIERNWKAYQEFEKQLKTSR
jgi:hypothetical protein